MTTFAEIFRELRALTLPGEAERARQQAIIDTRAVHVIDKAGMPQKDAYHVAIFSLGTWVMRYPIKSYDLGEEAAVFLARWCLARNRRTSDDVLHEALVEWRAREVARDLAWGMVTGEDAYRVAPGSGGGGIMFYPDPLAYIGTSANGGARGARRGR